MWTVVVLAIIVGIAAIWWFRRVGGHGEGMFAAHASGHLFDLGLDVKRLPDNAKTKFFQEAHALYTATKGSFHPKRLSMRYFSWYCVEYPDFDPRPLLREGVIAGSIPIMRSWAAAEPQLADAAEKEVSLIVQHLYKGFEKLDASEEDKITAQLALLELASSDNRSIFGGEDAESSDELQRALEDDST